MTIKARDVPALVHLHQDYLRTHDYQGYAAGYFRSAFNKTDLKYQRLSEASGFDIDIATVKMGADFCADEAHLLNIARLFHVTEPMMEVAKHAARQLPDDARWTREALPAMAGVLVFEKALRVEDVWGQVLAFNAVTWHWRDGFYGPAPGKPEPRNYVMHGPDKAIQFNFYTDNDDPGDTYNPSLRQRRENAPKELNWQLGRWELAHAQAHFQDSKIGPYSLLDVGDDLYTRWRNEYIASASPPTDMSAEPVIGEYMVQSTNITRIMYSIFALMDQTITDVSEYTDRKLARRTRNKRRPPPMVTIVTLRHAKSHGKYDGDGSWLTYRSVTAGHWRWQPYGPGRQQVKHIWINPYVRGPEDAPFHQPERISTLAR